MTQYIIELNSQLILKNIETLIDKLMNRKNKLISDEDDCEIELITLVTQKIDHLLEISFSEAENFIVMNYIL